MSFAEITGRLAENGNQAEKSSGEQECQQRTKAGVPRKGPAEEKRHSVSHKRHRGIAILSRSSGERQSEKHPLVQEQAISLN
jgi:hypothetical protein